MSARRQRESDYYPEHLVKGGFILLLLLAFGIGGLGGFVTALWALIMLAIVLLIFGFAGYLIYKSSLIVIKRIGLLLMLAGVFLSLVWYVRRAPPMWPEVQFKVVSVKAPAAEATVDYTFLDAGAKRTGAHYTVHLRREWSNLSEAENSVQNPLTIYYNPQNPNQAAEKYTPGWLSTRATPGPAEIGEVGSYTAQIQRGTLFNQENLAVTGPVARHYKVGQPVTIWSNPMKLGEYSFVPQATVGGNYWGMLAGAIGLLVAGIACVMSRKEWTDPARAAARAERWASLTGRPTWPSRAKSSAELLAEIDWYQFEKVCARLLELEGWEVERRGGAKPDGGADLLARRDGTTAVVQCKQWKSYQVMPKTLRELLGTKVSVGFTADTCILFSFGECTDAAKEFAEANGIKIYMVDHMVELINRYGVSRFPELVNPHDKRCPRCESPMLYKQGEGYASFWGCSTFPRCRGTIKIEDS